MLSDIGYRAVACDLDPQANLTAAFLNEERLEQLWVDAPDAAGQTVMQCVRPLTRAGDIRKPALVQIALSLGLIPGDLALAGFEDVLSTEWPNALGSGELYRSFRVLTAFAIVMQKGRSR